MVDFYSATLHGKSHT
jgi:hypothetical protein